MIPFSNHRFLVNFFISSNCSHSFSSMAIDAKDIQIFVWKIIKFSMNICYRFAQKHPFLSGVGLLFFLLYLFLPCVFFYLIYSSPVIVSIYVFMRYKLKLKRPEIKSDKRADDKSSAVSKSHAAAAAVSKNDNKPVINDCQVSRRKNVNKKFEGSNQEAGITLATTPVDDSIVGSQNVITEENGSASLEHGESSSSRNVSGADNVQASDQSEKVLKSKPSMDDLVVQKELGDQTEKGNAGDGGGGGEKEEESSDEEETLQNRNNAVEWTADDQQNLMDLGDSELERNKRLESLIARRRARKSFKMAIEKAMMESAKSGGQIPPLSIVRNSILNSPNDQDYTDGLQIPGSAPSILLPARNPFDIPYDPNEERPILTGDSFDAEFTIPQKDLLFCRHESFFLGPSFSLESQQDQRDSHFGDYGIEKRAAPERRLPRYRTASDMSDHDQRIDDSLASQEGEPISRNLSATDLVELGSQSPKESQISEESKHGKVGMDGEEAIENSADRSEFQMDTDSTRDNSSEPWSLASDEASEMSFQANTSSNTRNLVPKADKHRQHLIDRVKSSPTFTIPEDIALNGLSYDSGPSTFDKPRLDGNLFFRDRGHCHSPGYSIASDLQVEVSELGSPPLPIDETMSPTDAESYDGDIDKEVTSGSEELWGASCHLAGVDENESKSREVMEVSMDDILKAGISTVKQKLENQQVASTSLPAQVTEQQGKSNTSSFLSSRTGIQEDLTHSKHPNNKVSKNVQQVVEEVSRSSSYSHSLPPQIPKRASSSALKESLSHQTNEVSLKKLEELSNLTVEESAKVNDTPEVDDEEEHASNDKENLKSTEEMGGGSEILTDREAIMNMSQPTENITSASSNDNEQNCDKPAEQETEIEPEGEPPKLNEPEIGSSSMTTELQDEQNTTEAGVSGVNQSFDNPIMSPAEPQILEADQISTVSSSCSSPRSVLLGKNRTFSSASFDQQTPIQNDEPQSSLDDIVRNNSLDHMSTESVVRNNSLDDMSTESVVINNLLDGMSTESAIPVSAPEISQHLVADPIDFISSGSGVRISEEPLSEVVDGTSEPVINLQADVVASDSVDDSPSKSEKIAADSNASGNMMKEEEALNSPVQPTIEAHLTDSINSSVENQKENKGKSVVGGEGESKNVMEDEKATEPSVPKAETAAEKEPSDPLSQKPIAEAGAMHNVNETVADDTSNNAK